MLRKAVGSNTTLKPTTDLAEMCTSRIFDAVWQRKTSADAVEGVIT